MVGGVGVGVGAVTGTMAGSVTAACCGLNAGVMTGIRTALGSMLLFGPITGVLLAAGIKKHKKDKNDECTRGF